MLTHKISIENHESQCIELHIYAYILFIIFIITATM